MNNREPIEMPHADALSDEAAAYVNLPDEVFLVFERGAFLGCFLTEGGAAALVDDRRRTGKRGLAYGRFKNVGLT